jgi:hypothetical protein
MAAPWIIFGTINQASPDRIQVNIANQFKKIGIFLTNNSLVPTLKHMPHPIVSSVEILGIPGMKSLQNLR